MALQTARTTPDLSTTDAIRRTTEAVGRSTDALRRAAEPEPTNGASSKAPHLRPGSPAAAAFLSTLRDHELRLPDLVDVRRAGVVLDLYYPDSDAAVVFVADRHPRPDLTELLFEGLDVVEITSDADPWSVIAARPDLFGIPANRPSTPRSLT